LEVGDWKEKGHKNISAGGQHEHHTNTQTRSPRPPAEKQVAHTGGKLKSKLANIPLLRVS